jgi:hypothetical protein
MEVIYFIDTTFVIDPHDPEALKKVNPQYRDRVSRYLQQRMREWGFYDEDFRFYILSKIEELRHRPYKPRYGLAVAAASSDYFGQNLGITRRYRTLRGIKICTGSASSRRAPRRQCPN